MRRPLLLLLALLAGGIARPDAGAAQFREVDAGRRNAARWLDAPYVVMISFDGLRHDHPDRVPTPSFARLARRGVRAGALLPSFPTKTFPNHYSLATGMRPRRHGIVGNEMWDDSLRAAYRLSDPAAVRDPRWYGGEPIWVTAERQGMLSGVFFWPGSEAPIGGLLPSRVEAYDEDVPDEARVDSLLAWLRLPPERRPHLLLGYVSAVDDAGHEFGPEAPETDAAIRHADAVLGRLLDGIDALPFADRVHVVVVSDHGMTDVSRAEVVLLSDFIDLDAVRVVGSGPFAQLFLGGDSARIERAHAALRGLPRGRVFRTGRIPPHLSLGTGPRAGDLLVLMDPPHLVMAERAAGEPPHPRGGEHGYDGREPEMRGVFLAAGPGIRRGARIGTVDDVDVHPLLAHLLGLEPARGIDGRLTAVAPLLADSARMTTPAPAPAGAEAPRG